MHDDDEFRRDTDNVIFIMTMVISVSRKKVQLLFSFYSRSYRLLYCIVCHVEKCDHVLWFNMYIM